MSTIPTKARGETITSGDRKYDREALSFITTWEMLALFRANGSHWPNSVWKSKLCRKMYSSWLMRSARCLYSDAAIPRGSLCSDKLTATFCMKFDQRNRTNWFCVLVSTRRPLADVHVQECRFHSAPR